MCAINHPSVALPNNNAWLCCLYIVRNSDSLQAKFYFQTSNKEDNCSKSNSCKCASADVTALAGPPDTALVWAWCFSPPPPLLPLLPPLFLSLSSLPRTQLLLVSLVCHLNPVSNHLWGYLSWGWAVSRVVFLWCSHVGVFSGVPALCSWGVVVLPEVWSCGNSIAALRE